MKRIRQDCQDHQNNVTQITIPYVAVCLFFISLKVSLVGKTPTFWLLPFKDQWNLCRAILAFVLYSHFKSEVQKAKSL